MSGRTKAAVYNIAEAKAHLPELVERASAGETIVARARRRREVYEVELDASGRGEEAVDRCHAAGSWGPRAAGGLDDAARLVDRCRGQAVRAAYFRGR
jgi:hypothetical protein